MHDWCAAQPRAPPLQVWHAGLWPVQDPSHPKCGCHSNRRWLWVSSFLKIPVLTSNLVTNRLWTNISSQATLWVSPPYLILAITLWEPYYSHLNVTKKLRHCGVLNLKNPRISAELESKASQCPEEPVFVLTPELVPLPMCLCHFNYTWRRNSLV